MTPDTLVTSMAAISAAWGPLNSELVDLARRQIEALTKASPEEPWLASLHRDRPSNRELYRDPQHGFVLLAHFEPPALYRPPHDHGRSWVIYAVQQGEIEMGTYDRINGADGAEHLADRQATLLRPGCASVYLPGDVHDTLCVAGPALLFRFTERDLKHEDLTEHRITRFRQQNGRWSAP